MATPSHAARRFSWRALAGAIVLAGTLSFGAFAPLTAIAQDSGYIGHDTPSFAEGQSVAVRTDDGGGLNLRMEPSADSEQLGSLRDGAVVTVVFGPEYDGYGNGWYLVTDGSLRAFAYAGFLVAGSQQAAVSSQQSEVSSESDEGSGYLGYETPQFSAGQSIVVQTDDGGGLSLRMEPGVGAEKISAARDGAALTVVDGPFFDGSNNGWYLVTDGSIRAYAYAGFLVAGSQQAASSGQTSAASDEQPDEQPNDGGYLGYETPQFSEGAAVVVRTDDGGGLSLRFEPSVSAEKLSAARDGASLTIVSGPVYDESNNGWYLVTDGSIRAYAYGGFLAAGSQQPAASSESQAASTQSSESSGYLGYETPQFTEGQSVEVITDDGGGLSLRQDASVGAEQLVAVRDGTVLTIVQGPVFDGSNNGWYLVTNGTIRAYAFAGFLVGSSQPSIADGQSASSSQQSAASRGYLGFDTPEFSEGQVVEIRTDDGGGLSLRMEPDLDSDQLAAMRDGSTVTIVQGPVYDGSNNGWYLVNNGSIRAYAYAGFLAASSQQSEPSGQTSAASSQSSASSGYLGFDTPSFSEWQRVEIRTDDGGGLSLRSDATVASEQIRALRDGAEVTVVGGPYYDGANNGWYLVTDGSIRAYAYAGFLVASSQQPAASSQTSSSSQAASFAIGDTATTEGTTNVRNGASTAGSLLGQFSGGDIVEITDGPFYDRNGESWYYIVGDSVQGFVMGDFLIAAAAAASNQVDSSSGATGSLIYPLADYTFTQGYGCSSLGFYAYNAAWGCRVHNGIDLSAPFYTPILAADGGTVVEAGWCDCGLGYYVKIDHGNGLATLYGHMAEMPYVRDGQTVNQGDTIGPIGSTGLSTGPHTHFMVQENGVTVNPLDYL